MNDSIDRAKNVILKYAQASIPEIEISDIEALGDVYKVTFNYIGKHILRGIKRSWIENNEVENLISITLFSKKEFGGG